MRFLLFFMLSFALIFSVAAYKIVVVAPTQIEVQEKSAPVDLGLVGPGQKLEIQVLRNTQEPGFEGAEIMWDELGVLPNTLPAGWDYENSTLRQNPLTAFITVPKDAKDGVYTFQFMINDISEGLGKKVFTVQAKVSKDVLQARLIDSNIKSGAGLPAVFEVEINNLASANDYFRITVSGVPKQMEQTRTVFLQHNSKQVFTYELLGSETQKYDLIINVDSLSSDLIKDQVAGTLLVSSSLSEDAKSIGKGLMLFPISEQAIYSLIGFFSNLFFK